MTLIAFGRADIGQSWMTITQPHAENETSSSVIPTNRETAFRGLSIFYM